METYLFFVVLAGLISLFLFSKFAYDASALAVLIVIYLLGFVSEQEAFSGFSSPAVIIFISTLILSISLQKTGVASQISLLLAKWAGNSEKRNIFFVMLIGGIVSGLMSNVATVALMLPTVIGISQINRINPAKLLLPLSFAVIVGGLLTQIGSTANIVASEVLKSDGQAAFGFFELAPFGLSCLVAAICFMLLFYDKLLPARSQSQELGRNEIIRKVYRLHEELFYLAFDSNSAVVGKSLAESNLSAVLGLRVLAIFTHDKRKVDPKPDYIIKASDRLLVFGTIKRLENYRKYFGLIPERKNFIAGEGATLHKIASQKVFTELTDEIPALGKISNYPKFTIDAQKDELRLTSAQELTKNQQAFYLLLPEGILPQPAEPDFANDQIKQFSFLIPADSALIGQNPAQLTSVSTLGFKVLNVGREQEINSAGQISELEYGDRLYCVGSDQRLAELTSFSALQIIPAEQNNIVESAGITLTELALSPRAKITGQSLAEIKFSSTYDLQVLALWRAGKAVKGNLANTKLQFGDSLLIQGTLDKIHNLNNNSDFLPLYNTAPPERTDKAKYAVAAMITMISLSVFNLVPIYIAAMLAALIVIFTGAISSREAYQEIPWHVVILVGALIPFGLAFKSTGAADLVSTWLLTLTSDSGFLLSALILALAACAISQALDVIIAVILVGQIAVSVAAQSGFPLAGLLMAITCGASFAFLTPFSHKANLLVMAPGGYKNKDFFKVGLPYTTLMFVVLTLVLWVRY